MKLGNFVSKRLSASGISDTLKQAKHLNAPAIGGLGESIAPALQRSGTTSAFDVATPGKGTQLYKFAAKNKQLLAGAELGLKLLTYPVDVDAIAANAGKITVEYTQNAPQLVPILQPGLLQCLQ